MRNPLVEKWEESLNNLLKETDLLLEQRFGDALPRHPARLPAGKTGNPQQDGLFRVTATFTAGFGSRSGRGYLVEIDVVSLAPIPEELKRQVDTTAVDHIREGLGKAFPGKSLEILRDGAVWKIVGDLSLTS